MSNKSFRRVTVAAGAILAGAAIPLAAAGSAWADDPPLPGLGQLVADGVPLGEAIAAEAAAAFGQPVAVSVDGVTYTDAQAAADGTTALSGAVKSDVAVAIGNGSYAAATGASGDNAYASGKDAQALALGTSDRVYDVGNNPNNTGYGAEATGNSDNVTVFGNSDVIVATGSNDTVGVAGGTTASGDVLLDSGNHDLVGVLGNDLGSLTSPVDITHSGTMMMPYFESVTPLGPIGF